MKILKIFLFILCAIFIFTLIGWLSGNFLYQYLNDEGLFGFTTHSLLDGIHTYYKDPHFAHAFYGLSVLAAFIFLPVFMGALFLWVQFFGRNKSLYGDARFANNREMEPFHYKGDYN